MDGADPRARKPLDVPLPAGLRGGEEDERETTELGHVVWGENYRRGAFMADLNAAMREAGVALHGELPDHLQPHADAKTETAPRCCGFVAIL